MEENTKGKRVDNSKAKTNKTKSKKKKGSNKATIVKRVFTVLFILGTIGICSVLFLLYGPFPAFREWLVTTAMTTMTHQYFATWFYDDR